MTSQTGVSTVVVRPSRSRAATWLLPVFAILVLVYAITLTAPNLLAIGFIFERHYNEGWNVYNAQRLIDHELIYDSDYWRMNNYPLFSFLLVVGVNFIVHNTAVRLTERSRL
jgi:hypothetical protein